VHLETQKLQHHQVELLVFNQEYMASFFNNQMSNNEDILLPNFKSMREMLELEVSDLKSLYIGTCGHFLSNARIRMYFFDSGELDFSSAWNFVVNRLAEEMMEGFLEEKTMHRAEFYSRLHRAIFLTQEFVPYFHRTCNPDPRYIHGDWIFSPLFAQAYRLMLISQPPPRALCAALKSLKNFENPGVREFCIERFVLDHISELENHLIDILPLDEHKSDPVRYGRFCYEGSWRMPNEILQTSDTLREWMFLPLKWNEMEVDAVFVFTSGQKAFVIGIQITLGSAASHSRSLSFFRSNTFEEELWKYYDVFSCLVFVCNRENTSNLNTSIAQAGQKDVYDFPLYAIIDEALDDKIVKGNGAKASLRKLQVSIQTSSTELASCQDIECANRKVLRSFCKEYGGIVFSKNPSTEEMRQQAMIVHQQFNPCERCAKTEQSKISRIFEIKNYIS
jgi:hypothetical protein